MQSHEEIRQFLPSRIDALGIPTSALAAISGMPQPELSGFFLGSRRPNINKLQRVVKCLEHLESLIERCRPLPLDFRQSAAIKALLAKMSEGDLTIQIQDRARSLSMPSAVGGLSALAGVGMNFQSFESACSEELSEKVNQLLNGKKRETYKTIQEK
jgi:hypothetical protein